MPAKIHFAAQVQFIGEGGLDVDEEFEFVRDRLTNHEGAELTRRNNQGSVFVFTSNVACFEEIMMGES